MTEDEESRRERRERELSQARLPAGLEGPGRDEDLVHPPEVHPAGMRGDSRSSVPGTEIPDPDAAEAEDRSEP
ncbi:MAG TPA: hypothetical protein VK326_07410 [Solirubrobacterales bacterium]|nr:hypothetical protein [Solirubrobacterales bacterium]